MADENENEKPEAEAEAASEAEEGAADSAEKAAGDGEGEQDLTDMSAWGMDENGNPAEGEVDEADWGLETNSAMGQDDIDEMFGTTPTKQEFKNVIDRMIKTALSNYDRLPMLDIVFDRFVMVTTSSIKKLTSSNVEIDLRFVESKRYNEGMGALPLPGLLAVVDAESWNGQFVMAIDAPLLYSGLELMLGGRKSKATRPEGRSFTSIERKIAGSLMDTMLKDLQEAFTPLCEVTFEIDRLEANPQFATVAQNNSPCVHAVLDIDIDGRKGQAEFVIPYGTIDPIRKSLQKVFLGERLGGDPQWSGHMEKEVSSMTLELEAIFSEIATNLGTVMKWKEGDVIDLGVPLNHQAVVHCGNIPMFRGLKGKNNGKLALKIQADLGRTQEVIDGLTSD